MGITAALEAIIDADRDLSEAEAAAAMGELMADPEAGGALPAQAAALLTALRLKGETVEELVGFARTMRARSLRVDLGDGFSRIADTCGTGGDAKGTFNVSTAAAFVVAGCGVPVAKHGNRAMSSACGSADVLEGLGARVDLPPAAVAAMVRDVGIGFMFAQTLHPAMRHVAPVRRALGFRTVFNLLGPLTNPAGARHQLIGVGSHAVGDKIAATLKRLDAVHALVVHGLEGLDEVSPSGPTQIWELEAGQIRKYLVQPSDFHIRAVPLDSVRGGDAVTNAAAMRSVLGGSGGPLHGFVALNAAAALLAADEVPTFAEGISRAVECIDDGRALRKLERFVEATRAVTDD
ncbi:MAG: anthranilate phosphoribosyltransferase [Chloroflexi bacterium]|nr:anthranilate phosphoribosyltransferase [Chloroflexota bacterium]